MATKPTAPPLASGTTYVRGSRLLDNPALTRMPTNQQEWNGFILELNKWVRSETYGFDPTFTGFSSAPGSASVLYQRYGQFITLQFDYTSNGTSNATDFTITNLPSEITPKVEQIYPITGLVDNGTSVYGNVKIQTDGVLTFYTGPNAFNTWTASGVKGFDGRSNSVTYSLFSVFASTQAPVY